MSRVAARGQRPLSETCWRQDKQNFDLISHFDRAVRAVRASAAMTA